MNRDDLDLLQRYASEGAEDAFAALMHRYLNLVYSSALRQVRSPEMAEEVTQSVFADLARNARRMKPDTLLSAWLYRVTRCTAIDRIRHESRRQAREFAATQLAPSASAGPDWQTIEPVLDEAIAELEDSDRDAILLRFFETKSLKEVGLALGVSEEAARKRVTRAVDRLRGVFARRRIALTSVGLGAILTAHAVHAAPAGLVPSVLASISAGASLSAAAATITKTTIMTTAQKCLLAASLTAAVGGGVVGVHRNLTLERENRALRQQQSALDEQVGQLTRQRDEATAKVDDFQTELALLRQETPKLRGEVIRLRREMQELAQAGAAASAPVKPEPARALAAEPVTPEVNARLALLKQRLEQAPEKAIPELRWLNAEDWLQAALLTQGESEIDLRKGLSILRSLAKNKVSPAFMHALTAYTEANQGELPATVTDLKPYFDTPVEDALLDRYEIFGSGNINAEHFNPYKPVVREKSEACIDKLYDPFQMISLKGYGSGGGRGVVFPKGMVTQTVSSGGPNP